MIRSRSIAVTAHGRYLVERPEALEPTLALVGFHGYAESAETQLDRLRAIPGSEHWVLVSVQGLHRFYKGRTEDVVAGWMTRQDRDLAIADNINYVVNVVGQVWQEWPSLRAAVFAGFSQGVAMAYRAACWVPQPVAGVVALGGDVPPDLDLEQLRRVGAALVGRGQDDVLYSAESHETDLARLRGAEVRVHACPVDGGHAWTPAFGTAADDFIAGLQLPPR